MLIFTLIDWMNQSIFAQLYCDWIYVAKIITEKGKIYKFDFGTLFSLELIV